VTSKANDLPPENKLIQGLWIGSSLSIMEQLSIASFLSNGHDYHLYIYDAIQNVPAGATVLDANEILPASMIFQYQQHKSVSGFSNFFRYKLLFEKGGWWADTDVVCLKPFDIAGEYVFSSEIAGGKEFINCGVVKAPPGSRAMEYAWNICQTKQPEKLTWGEVGPHLIAESIKAFGIDRFVMRPRIFCPLGYAEWDSVLNPNQPCDLDDSYAIHLWNEMWRRNKMDKDQSYHPGCLYERLKLKYLGQHDAGSIGSFTTQLSVTGR